MATYTGLGYWTPQGYWRFPIGNADRPGGWVETLRAQATDGDLAVEEWNAFRNRLKDLCGTMSAVSLLNLRQVLLGWGMLWGRGGAGAETRRWMPASLRVVIPVGGVACCFPARKYASFSPPVPLHFCV